jgi:hypothetical protein
MRTASTTAPARIPRPAGDPSLPPAPGLPSGLWLVQQGKLAGDGDLWLTEEPDPEVLKAGRWDRARGNGDGFAAGGVTDDLPPGPVLAGFADDAWTAGLGRLSDDELIAHGCARTGPPAGLRRTQPEAVSRAGPETWTRASPGTRAGARPETGTRAGSGTRPRDGTWTFAVTPLRSPACDHASETPGYRPSAALRHLVEIRQPTCSHPGCRRPAARCDVDHTVAYHLGGRTCLCNLAPLCRRHHRVKQARGWALKQVSRGVLTWSTPAGRRYILTSI